MSLFKTIMARLSLRHLIATATLVTAATMVGTPDGTARADTIADLIARGEEASFEIYGFGQVDYIQDFNRVDPSFRDTLRPSRIPVVDGQYGADGLATLSVRQSRLGVKADLPTSAGNVRTMFEFDMFGVGVDEGQTTMRLRHAYGEWGCILGGQTHSLFMDISVFPNTIDYWGPAGMVFLRNPQIRWTPVEGRHTVAFALEQPFADVDVGSFDRIIDILGIDLRGATRAPAFTSRYRLEDEWGHLQVAGILRQISYETITDPPNEGNRPKGNNLAWGVNISSNLLCHDRDRLIGSFVIGEGIASYMNDGGVDLGPVKPFPFSGSPETVPLRGYVLYYDHYWSDRWSSSIGGSMTEVDNLGGQKADAFKRGLYSSVNLLFTPTENVLCGIEYLWGSRENNDGQSGEDNRIQTSFKYSF